MNTEKWATRKGIYCSTPPAFRVQGHKRSTFRKLGSGFGLGTARVEHLGLAPPLYLHWQIPGGALSTTLSGANVEASWESITSQGSS